MAYKAWDDLVARKCGQIGGRRRAPGRTGTGRFSRAGTSSSPAVSSGPSTLSLRLLQIRYRLNSLRLLTWLVRIGFPRPWAMAIARWWEGVRHPWARGLQ